jgi:hypothetical protein
MFVNTVTIFLYIPCYYEKKNKLFRLTFLRRGVLSVGSPSPPPESYDCGIGAGMMRPQLA